MKTTQIITNGEDSRKESTFLFRGKYRLESVPTHILENKLEALNRPTIRTESDVRERKKIEQELKRRKKIEEIQRIEIDNIVDILENTEPHPEETQEIDPSQI